MGQGISGKAVKFAKGDTLIRENEISRKLFVLKSGRVRVSKAYMGQKITLAILGEGEIFGEMSFFDGQPRSASVEALTPVECFVVDSSEAEQHFKGMPEWFMPIVKTVFERLRSTDTRTTMLASMNEVEKRHFKRDSVAEGLYREILRFNKVFNLVFERAASSGKEVTANRLLQDLDEVLGERSLSLQTYWRLLKECDFIDVATEGEAGVVTVNRNHFAKWIHELNEEVEAERFTLLSHSSVAMLKKLVSHLNVSDESYSGTPKVKVRHEDLDFENMPLADEAIAELIKQEIIEPVEKEMAFLVEVPKAFRVYTYQSLLKYFDHTIQHI